MGYEINDLREKNEMLKMQNIDLSDEILRLKNERSSLEFKFNR